MILIKRFVSRRALFYVPGSDEKKLKSALKLSADCIVYDLEDSVPIHRKGTARQLVFDALENSQIIGEKAVRINSIGSKLEVDDLNVILSSKKLEAIVIPKVTSVKDVEFVTQMCQILNNGSVRLLACIENAIGLMNIREIASSPNVDALIFAAEDYSADTGVLRTPSRLELLYARQKLVAAAKAYGKEAIDLVCVDYQNQTILKEECIEGRQFGFTGKQAIHPSQIDTIHSHFLPDPQDVERAQKIIDGYKQYSAKGIGAFVLDGKMIDTPVIKWAEKLLQRSNSFQKQ